MPTQTGFSLLECLCVLAIMAILSYLAVTQTSFLLAHRALAEDTRQLQQALQTTQLLAMSTHQTAALCGDTTCQAQWEKNLFIVTDRVITQIPLSGKNTIFIRAFPIYKSNQFIFKPNGWTDFQNASLYVCSNNKNIAKRVVINQGGRIRIMETIESCSAFH